MRIQTEKPNRPIAAAIDLGSTRFKLALLDDNNRLFAIQAMRAPPLHGNGLIREANAHEFLDSATNLLRRLPTDAAGIPVGLVCQRSSFTVWDKQTGQAAIPMVSWRDRRAEQWCQEHTMLQDRLQKYTGLRLSPHYVGPKLAAMQQQDRKFARQLASGKFIVGNLDAWLVWHWTAGRVHQTDVSMAARTAMLDIEHFEWSAPLLNDFQVPAAALPKLVATQCPEQSLGSGLSLRVSIADQAASALAVLEPGKNVALVNFGTGAFVLVSARNSAERKPGYLMAPTFGEIGNGNARFVLEGTINGAGPAVDRFGPGPTEFPVDDPCPDGFAIPDQTGIGSPHWRADFGLTLSRHAHDLPALDKRRCVLEGLLFRVREILGDLENEGLPDHVLISGGLVQDPGVAAGLSSLLGHPVSVLREPETTLLGTARLAAGLEPYVGPDVLVVEPTDAGAYLPDKYLRWRQWLRRELALDTDT
jgi:glycerol kinase